MNNPLGVPAHRQGALVHPGVLVSDRSQTEDTHTLRHRHAGLPHELDVDVCSLETRKRQYEAPAELERGQRLETHLSDETVLTVQLPPGYFWQELL